MGVVTKISIRCKALDASPMFSALFSNAILNNLSLSQSQPMRVKFLIWRFSQHSKMNGWMTCDLTSFSTLFQSYQDDERLIMKGCMQ